MSKSKKSQLTRLRILDTAREYFIRKGYKEAHVNEIASLAFIDRRTVYRYFPTKESLLINIVNMLFDEFIDVIDTHVFLENISGYKKIEELLMEYFLYIKEKPDLPILLGMIDINVTLSEDVSIEAEKLSSYGHYLDKLLEELIVLGQEDGSISNNSNSNDLAVTINNSLLALTTRSAIYSTVLRNNPKAFSWKLIVMQGELLLKSLKCAND